MKKTCEICYEQQNVLIIECGHNYCKDCLKNMFFHNGQVDLETFECPQEKCKQKLTEKTLKLIIEDFQTKYEQFLKQGILFGINNNEKLITCLNIKCNSQFLIWKNADYFKCQNCKMEFCLKCKLTKHNGQTCIQALRLKQITKTRLKFLKQVENSSTQKICPHCFIVIEKYSGCNFMTCQSKSCNSKKYFCFQCGEPLQHSESKDHFEDSDPFYGRCNIKINGKWVEQDKLPANNVPCPKCKSQDPLKSKIEGNLLICTSKQCVDKIFCCICQIQLDDKSILNHLDKHEKIKIQQKSWFEKFNIFKK
ncbi:unnamed protein product [Paramecium sonneborni]|uniref:RBR-type E3 ubiquitin transferase n=1 Tax=Paramecium sonneborni TaxID=65129 RepID=A0A8S1KG46_9CILI|nr:unnamed protein product [Paramecium sonneborni]